MVGLGMFLRFLSSLKFHVLNKCVMSQRNKSLVVSMQVLGQSIPPELLVLQCSCPWDILAELALDAHVSFNPGHQGGINEDGYVRLEFINCYPNISEFLKLLQKNLWLILALKLIMKKVNS